MKTAAIAGFLIWLISSFETANAETPQRHIFDVRQYGAKGDGKTLDTKAIQQALDACGSNHGGTVLLPSGTYLSRPLIIRSNTTLQVEKGATLRATDDPAGYKRTNDGKKFHAFLSGED